VPKQQSLDCERFAAYRYVRKAHRHTTTKVILVILVLFLFLLVMCAVAPWLGTDTSDDRSEKAHPVEGWYPPLGTR
jgi:flagellar basal body-associated protein FliL